MIYTDNTRIAMRIAYEAHAGQKDMGGTPYIFHVMHVAEAMTTENACCAALLHDAVEKASVTVEQLREAGLPLAVTVAVGLLTRGEGEDISDHMRRLRGNRIAREVKLADLEHDCDLTRIPDPDGEDVERMRMCARARGILLEQEDQ